MAPDDDLASWVAADLLNGDPDFALRVARLGTSARMERPMRRGGRCRRIS
jgi:hypothetical protein